MSESPEADPAPGFRIAVRELCAFAAKSGDLDLRFTPAPSAQEGIAGHQAVALRRGPAWRAEWPLVGRYGPLEVRGRADGFDAAAGRLEEIKTHKGDLALQPANHRALHWAQAKVYAAMLCAEQGRDALEVALVYWDVAGQRETVFAQRYSAYELKRFFDALCARFVAWAAQEASHRRARDAALSTLPFLYPSMRPGQRQLAEQVYRAARAGRCLLAQAPTGIGKTLGTIFPLLKAAAAPGVGLDKLFYLSAKGPGRALALQALASLRAAAPAVPLRVVEMVSREAACRHPDKACHGESCPLARGFFDRLPGARAAAVATAAADATAVAAPAAEAAVAPVQGDAADAADAGPAPGWLDANRLRALAEAHAVCPYYLAQEMLRWADVVVGDYHYLFDGSAVLAGLQQANGWRVAVLVDEAHNLVDRARGMYSASLDQAALRALLPQVPAALKPAFKRLQRAWAPLTRSLVEQASVEPAREPFRQLDDVPAAWLDALAQLATATGDWLAAPAPAPAAAGVRASPPVADAALMSFYFEVLHVLRLAEGFGPHAMADIQLSFPQPRGRAVASRLAIRNVLPAPYLRPRFALAHTVVLFSATLGPADYQRDLLGLPEDTAWLDVRGPFRAEQLRVRLEPGISTRWRERGRSCGPIADALAAQYAAEPGNYLAFFSSFDYLAQVAAAFAERHPHIPHWCQQRGMDEAARASFIERFTADGQGIGFAVLGGAFGEGIDLPGRRLIGALVATLGLPQVNPVNARMCRRLEALFPGRGRDYTYLYPGIRKVVQAAGRVIRRPEDHGSLVLVDDRWRAPTLQALLPAWWSVPGRGPAEPG